MIITGLKTHYFRLSIHKQIQIGVFSVSSCVCILVFLLVVLNSLLILNLAYVDSMNILDLTENESLENIVIYLDTKLNYMIEDTKFSIQTLRNFAENNKRNRDFRENLIYDYNKYAIDASDTNISICNINSKLNCFVYKKLNPSIENEKFKDFMKIVTSSIALIRKKMDHRFYELHYRGIFNYFRIMSNVNEVVIYYPYTEFNNEIGYTPEIFKDSIKIISLEAAQNYFNRTLKSNEISNELNILGTSKKNPFLYLFSRLRYFIFPYKGAYSNSPGIFATTNMKYKNDSEEALHSNLADPDRVEDIIMGDWSYTMLDEQTFSATKKFKGVKILGTRTGDNQAILTPSSCHYLIKFNEIQNDYSNYTNNIFDTPLYLDDCFKDELSKNKLYKYFYESIKKDNVTVTFPQYDHIKRKSKFRFFKDYNNPDNTSKGIFFKIFKIKIPDLKSKLIVNSNFLSNFGINFYVLKNSMYNKRIFKVIYYRSITTFIFILFYNLASWYLVLISIIYILGKITGSISKPISDLIMAVNSIQSEKDHLNLNKQIKMITFPDDKDIDDLFKICRSLITGGFINTNVTQINKEPKKFNNGFQNIFYIKSNNLILNEEALENKCNKSVFTYKNEEIEPINQSFSIVNYSEDSICYEPEVIKKRKQTKLGDFLKNEREKIKIISSVENNSYYDLENSLEFKINNFIIDQESKTNVKGYLNSIFNRLTDTGNNLKIIKVDFNI